MRDLDHDDGSDAGESVDGTTIEDDSIDAATRAAVAAESAGLSVVDYLLRVAEGVEQEADEEASVDSLSRVFGNNRVDSGFSDESPRF